jgi:membrane fusion protein, multidrug efflux system
MKKLIIIALGILVASCSSKPNIDELIEEKNTADLQKLKSELQADLTKIDGYLNKTKTIEQALVSTKVINDTIFNHYVDVQGNVETRENIIIYPEFAGTLTALTVRNGQRVSKGQVLGRIADAGLSQQLAQAESGYALAKTTYERQKNLWDKKIGSEIQFLQAQAQMFTAKKSVALVREQIAKTIIKAPFTGTIEDVMVEKGQIIAPGDPRGLMRIVNTSSMFVTSEVPEAYIGKVKVGSNVEVFVTSVNKTLMGKVRQVSNNINAANRSFSIEVNVPNNENLLRPNQVAKLKIIDYSVNNAVVVPTNIIQEDGNGNKYIYIVEGNPSDKTGTAKKVMIKVGQSAGNVTEVLNGLSKNDVIVIEGFNTISEGSKLNF